MLFSEPRNGTVLREDRFSAVGHYCPHWDMKFFEPLAINKFEIDLTPQYEYPILMVNDLGTSFCFTSSEYGYWIGGNDNKLALNINEFKPLKQ